MAVIKTLDDIINRSDRYDINKITFFTHTDDQSLIIPDKNLIEIYARYIKQYVATFNVSEAERAYYRCKPYLLSFDVYKTVNLGWLIMYLNDRECASKFYLKRTIRLIPIEYLENVYDTIVTKSSARLQENWNRYRILKQ